MRDLQDAHLEDVVLVLSEVVSKLLSAGIILLLGRIACIFLLLSLSFVHERLHICQRVERILEGSIQAEGSVGCIQASNDNQSLQLVSLHRLDQPR